MTDEFRLHLGIEDWHLETNRFGHYLVFDGSEDAAHRLAEAVEGCGLGVVRWDDSTRQADDGAFYDWFIRLAFDGSREDCLDLVISLLHSELAEGEYVPTADDDYLEAGSSQHAELHAIASALVDTCGGVVHLEDAVILVEPFLRESGAGYLAWRFRELSTRPATAFDGSAEQRLGLMALIVRDDGDVLARLQRAYGAFLEVRPHLARKAIEIEFDKIDPDDGWLSSDAPHRRATASITFFRHASLLAFGCADSPDRLRRMVAQLAPPAHEHLRDMPHRVTVAVGTLRRMLEFFESLFPGEDIVLDAVLERGCAELSALKAGDFAVFGGLADTLRAGPAGTRDTDLLFVVLPPGEQFRTFVNELSRTGTYLKRRIDVKRLEVLIALGDYLETHGRQVEIHRGAFPSSPGRDNGYVVLTISHGGSKADAVAISPWEGEHATYLVRHDCFSRHPWHAVLSKTKREAKQLGAKRLIFQTKLSHGIDRYEGMRQKIVAWLECDPHKFEYGETYFDYTRRCSRVRIPDDVEYDDVQDGAAHVRKEHMQLEAPSLVQQVVNWFGRLF